MAKEKKEQDVVEERRSFIYEVGGELKTFYLGMPSSERIRKAEWHYSKVYNKALVEGVATTSEMMDILTKRGLYGPDYEKRLQELQVSIVEGLADMHGAENDEDKARAARLVQDLRDELYRWNQRITGPLSNSCEQMADDAKTEYLTSVVVQDENSELVWASHEEFVAEVNQGLALKARFEVLLWLQGLDADFLDKTPENEVLREIAVQRAAAEVEANKKPAQLEAAAKVETSGEENLPSKKTRRKRAPKKSKATK